MMPKMLMFSLYISCLSTSNLPWFMDLTFHVPIHHCSLQHQTLLSPSDTSTAAHLSGFGLGASFLPELLGIVLHSSPVADWTPSDLGSSSASILSFSFFIGFSRQEYWSGLLFPSPVDHNLSELLTMTCLSWVALHGQHGSSFHWVTQPLLWEKAVIHEGDSSLLDPVLYFNNYFFSVFFLILFCVFIFFFFFNFWLCWLFIAAWAFGGFSYYKARALESSGFRNCHTWAQQLWLLGSRAQGP